MKRTVRICGTAPTLMLVSPPDPHVEVWCCNRHKDYNKTRPAVQHEFTRWFNLHSLRHMLTAYPTTVDWYRAQVAPKRIILQYQHPEIARSETFPKDELLALARHRYITFSGAWLMLYAMHEQFEVVNLEGFEISSRKVKYVMERPNFFYWVKRLRDAGIEVTYPEVMDSNGDTTPGDPAGYEGPLYGYETT